MNEDAGRPKENLSVPMLQGFGDCMDECLNAMCCFCGEYAPIGSDDFVSLIAGLPEGASQELWAHGEYLRRVVHLSVPMLQPEDE